MREILFRGKRKDNDEWVEGHYGEYYNGNKNVPCISIPSKEAVSGSLCYEVILETVGQYTGMTDKNGKKIFEHDIVRIYVDFTTMQYVISYDKENARFVVGDTGFTFWSYISTKIEVIGNIHDNPELLKE